MPAASETVHEKKRWAVVGAGEIVVKMGAMDGDVHRLIMADEEHRT